MDTLTYLQTRHALIDNYNSYAEGLDSKNWELVRNCFADRVYLDYGSLGHSFGGPDVAVDSDDWIPLLRAVIDGFDVTRHTITNHRFDIDDEVVRCRAYMTADHVIFPGTESTQLGQGDVVTVVGEYTNQYQQSDAGWKIFRSRLEMQYMTGNAALLEEAGRRTAAPLPQ